MSEEAGLIRKVGRWFKRRFSSQDELPLLYGQTETPTAIARRPFFGWNRREEDLTTLQSGLTSMMALMSSLRQYLDQQSSRHDELLTYLSQLSAALQSIPDTGRVQGETLRVLHQQIAYQNAQHKQLSEMLRRITESSGTQQEHVEFLRDRVEALYKADQEISETINGMGNSVTVVSQQSQTNTMVLERLRDNLINRDGELERAIRRENRWTRSTLLIVGGVSLFALAISVGMAIYSWSAISQVADSVAQSRNHNAVPAPNVAPEKPDAIAPGGSATPVALPATVPVSSATTAPATAPAAAPVTAPVATPAATAPAVLPAEVTPEK